MARDDAFLVSRNHTHFHLAVRTADDLGVRVVGQLVERHAEPSQFFIAQSPVSALQHQFAGDNWSDFAPEQAQIGDGVRSNGPAPLGQETVGVS